MLKGIKNFIIRQNFSPGLAGVFINPFYFAREALSRNIKKLSNEITGKILDVGCGTKPYKEMFDYTEYIGLEIDSPENRKNKNVDTFYNGKTFPFKDGEFDSIVANQVLEHVFNPDEFLEEIKRVLNPGGKVLLTVPFVWDEHEQPYDYARYSSYGLTFLLEKHDFKISSQMKNLNNFRFFFQLLNAYFFKKVNLHNKYLNFIVISALTSIINLSGICLSIFFPTNNDLYLDNIILAEKSKENVT
ncbi:MAG: class I SAM-dependent methyltransferase [Victivallaceae bacterium]